MRIGAMLGDTIRSLLKKPVTEKYPFERLHPGPERLRGALSYQTGKCSGCGVCVKDCPANALEVVTLDKKAKKFVIVYHVDRCTFCAQCVKSCNYKCFAMANQEWELAGLKRESFIRYYGTDDEVKQYLAQRAQPDSGAAAPA